MTQHTNHPINGQPDDPGVASPEDDLSPLTFEPNGPEREIVKLGCVMVGQIIPYPGIKVRQTVLLCLPDARQSWPATDMVAARRVAWRRIGDWLEAAGLRPA